MRPRVTPDGAEARGVIKESVVFIYWLKYG